MDQFLFSVITCGGGNWISKLWKCILNKYKYKEEAKSHSPHNIQTNIKLCLSNWILCLKKGSNFRQTVFWSQVRGETIQRWQRMLVGNGGGNKSYASLFSKMHSQFFWEIRILHFSRVHTKTLRNEEKYYGKGKHVISLISSILLLYCYKL